MADALGRREPLLWRNPGLAPAAEVLPALPLGRDDIDTAHALLDRWAPALARLFPELEASGGRIASPLRPLGDPAGVLGTAPAGATWIKCDHALPVAGSVKTRGGIAEVLWHAESVARTHGLLDDANPHWPLRPAVRACFARHRIVVGSTGNLGLGIGTIAAALGFEAIVHMSAEAKAWKKARLRERGATVIEHAGDYAAAVAAGRAEAAADPRGYFVDDEDSQRLFLGYATAARELAAQFVDVGIVVDATHPLFVYLPCGVGGAPGGIGFGLKHVYGEHAHLFFAQPCATPSVLIRLAFPDRPRSVYAFGLDNVTEADGLAVPRASERVAALVSRLVSGVFTVEDETLFRHLARLHTSEGLRIEPSAAAGFPGPQWLEASAEGQAYLAAHDLERRLAQATHLLWSTGGGLLPEDEFARYLERGRALLAHDRNDEAASGGQKCGRGVPQVSDR